MEARRVLIHPPYVTFVTLTCCAVPTQATSGDGRRFPGGASFLDGALGRHQERRVYLHEADGADARATATATATTTTLHFGGAQGETRRGGAPAAHAMTGRRPTDGPRPVYALT